MCEVVAVVMGAADPKTRFGETMRLLDYGFANYYAWNGDPAGTVAGQGPAPTSAQSDGIGLTGSTVQEMPAEESRDTTAGVARRPAGEGADIFAVFFLSNVSRRDADH